MNTIEIISLTGSVIVLFLVAQLIRARRLREEYAILWFLASVVLIVFSVRRELLHEAAALLGIAYPPSLLLLGGLILGFLLSMHFSVSLSRLSEQNKTLAQELAILKLSIEGVEQRATSGPSALEPPTGRGDLEV